VLLFIAIFGIAALTIDLGFARLTQDEMQTAADASSLDGLRFGTSAAQAMATSTFTDPSGQTKQGPGPEVDLDAGETEIHASQDITNEVVAAAPQLQANAANLAEGDIVTGTYADDSSVPYPQLEAADYTRADFTPGAAGATSPALLVRLRRVNSVVPSATPSALDNTPGVSSSGTAVPFLFGHGAFIHGTGSDSDYSVYSPLRDGIKVRATAIASLQPAMAVGWKSAGTNVAPVGAAHFTIPDVAWTGATITVTLTSPPGVGLNYPGSGSFCQLAAGVSSPLVGATVSAVSGTDANDTGYVPLYRQLSSGRLAIVGFVYAQWTLAIDGDGDGTVTLTPQWSTTGPNASAVVWDGLAGLSSAEVQEILNAQRSIAAPVLQAPAQAR